MLADHHKKPTCLSTCQRFVSVVYWRYTYPVEPTKDCSNRMRRPLVLPYYLVGILPHDVLPDVAWRLAGYRQNIGFQTFEHVPFHCIGSHRIKHSAGLMVAFLPVVSRTDRRTGRPSLARRRRRRRLLRYCSSWRISSPTGAGATTAGSDRGSGCGGNDDDDDDDDTTTAGAAAVAGSAALQEVLLLVLRTVLLVAWSATPVAVVPVVLGNSLSHSTQRLCGESPAWGVLR